LNAKNQAPGVTILLHGAFKPLEFFIPDKPGRERLIYWRFVKQRSATLLRFQVTVGYYFVDDHSPVRLQSINLLHFLPPQMLRFRFRQMEAD
jgi:hypothetical protein